LYVKFKQILYLAGDVPGGFRGFAYILRLADHGFVPDIASDADRFPKGRDAQGFYE
jgi:hypothetical protein